MSNGMAPRDDAGLKDFLGRQSTLTMAYAAIEPVQPPDVLDAKVLAIANGAAAGKASPAQPPVAPKAAAPAAGGPKPAATVAARPAVSSPARRPPVPADEDEEAEASPARRPRWLVPVVLAAGALVAVGIGLNLLGGDSTGTGEEPGAGNRLGSLFAKRARERSEADKASAAAAAAEEAEVMELPPLPPPPFFEPEGPRVEDLDTAIALIRRELVVANQMAALADDARAEAPEPQSAAGAGTSTEASTAAGVIQPRERRLAKILELYDGDNPELAGASLEIFLRDFAGDPISQRIIDSQPRATDVAVE